VGVCAVSRPPPSPPPPHAPTPLPLVLSGLALRPSPSVVPCPNTLQLPISLCLWLASYVQVVTPRLFFPAC
jgi:hypothetical protein